MEAKREPQRYWRRRSWSPYLVGVGIGVLSWFAFATVNKPIGITTAFENTAALSSKAAAPGWAQQHQFFSNRAQEGKPPRIDWEWMLVVGVFFGAFLSSGDPNVSLVVDRRGGRGGRSRVRAGGAVTPSLDGA